MNADRSYSEQKSQTEAGEDSPQADHARAFIQAYSPSQRSRRCLPSQVAPALLRAPALQLAQGELVGELLDLVL
jgi:hypothetical protein